MNKLIISWMVMYLSALILTSIYQGGGAVVSTTLTQPLTQSETTTIYVASTTGMLTADTVYVENEQIRYTGKTASTLTGLTRAYNNTSSAAHPSGSSVYSQEMGILNQSSGGQLAQVDTTGGTAAVLGFNVSFLWRAIPQLVVWNFPFLAGQLVFLRLFLSMVGIGLTVSIVLSGLGAFQSMIRGR